MQKESELKKKAAQAAAVEKNAAQAAKKSEEEATLVAKRNEEERAAQAAKDAETQTVPGPRIVEESYPGEKVENNISLRQRKRKAIVDPANDIVEVGSSEVPSHGSQFFTSLLSLRFSSYLGQYFQRGVTG